MIYIERLTTPDCLLKNEVSNGHLETKRAIHHYTNTFSNEFNFKEYKKVKGELIEMFSGKCAYCESIIEHITYMNVEHYRPKGYVEGSPKGTPGYYWLGSDWDNLLLACDRCNGSEHKGNHFPLKDYTKRVTNHNDNIEVEEPLLINPCKEKNPEDHLIFNNDGEINGVTIEGLQSIKYYGLYRESLRKVRAEHLGKLNLLLIALDALIEKYDKNNTIKTEKAIREILESFKKNKENSAQFAGMSRQYLDEKIYDLILDIE